MLHMSKVIRHASVLALLVLLAPLTRAADEVPNINNRGSDEKKFVEKLTRAVLSAARSSVKSAKLVKYEKKEPKPGRTELHITAEVKGAERKQDYSASIVVHIDTPDDKSWEVLRIEYRDTSKTLVPINRKSIEEVAEKLNGKK
jgi:hypothetical protein